MEASSIEHTPNCPAIFTSLDWGVDVDPVDPTTSNDIDEYFEFMFIVGNMILFSLAFITHSLPEVDQSISIQF